MKNKKAQDSGMVILVVIILIVIGGWYFFLYDNGSHNIFKFNPFKNSTNQTDKCFQVCKYVGTRSEGWYNSCDNSLILYDTCSDSNTTNGTCLPGHAISCTGSFPPHCYCAISSCGNGICESGEASFCPSCVYSVPRCVAACQVGTCPQDCLTINQQSCNAAGGLWTNCGSTCQLDNQGVDGTACPTICGELCECGGFAGYKCPTGFHCKMPTGINDAMGYCVHEGAL